MEPRNRTRCFFCPYLDRMTIGGVELPGVELDVSLIQHRLNMRKAGFWLDRHRRNKRFPYGTEY